MNDVRKAGSYTMLHAFEIGHKEWSISNGVKYEELGTLPLNGMSKLQYLDITNYNKVTKLNIDKCTQLEELYMRGTDGLTSIILPKTITLKNIEFGKNISVLDVSNLIGLQSINFESTANLTELTAVNCSEYMKKESYNIISNSPKLTKANLDINWGSIDSPIKIDNFYMKNYKIQSVDGVSMVVLNSKTSTCECRNCGAIIEKKEYFTGSCKYCGSSDLFARVLTKDGFYSISNERAKANHKISFYDKKTIEFDANDFHRNKDFRLRSRLLPALILRYLLPPRIC